MQHNGWRSAGARQVEDLSDIWTFSGGAQISRASLLATASPSAAQAQFGGMNRIISGPVAGPIFSDGGAITVTKSGSITSPSGVTGLAGVDVTVYSTTALTNRGAITGGAGGNTPAMRSAAPACPTPPRPRSRRSTTPARSRAAPPRFWECLHRCRCSRRRRVSTSGHDRRRSITPARSAVRRRKSVPKTRQTRPRRRSIQLRHDRDAHQQRRDQRRGGRCLTSPHALGLRPAAPG